MLKKGGPEVSQEIRRIFTSVSILWLGYLFIGIIIAGAWWIISEKSTHPIIKGFSPDLVVQLRNVLMVIGIVEILIGLWLKNKFLESLKLREKSTPLNFFFIAKSYAQAHLIPSALALSVTFFGLLIGLVGGDKNSVILMFIISFFGLWLFQPRIKQLQSVFKPS